MMLTLLKLRQRAGHILIPTFFLGIITYFLSHAIYDDHGLIAWFSLRHQIEAREAKLHDLRETRERIDLRSSLLRDGIDRDLLDERARALLGLSHPDDIIIFKND